MKRVLPVFALVFLAGAADAAAIAPHRAIYDMTLLRANEGSSVQSATGKLAFEIDGSTCDGFTVSFRMAMKYRPDEGDVTVIDTMSTTYESPGATELRHQLTEKVDGSVKDSARIKVTRRTAADQGEGVIAAKPDEPFTIPAGAMLPVQHQLRLMALGEAGGGRDSSIVYDGSDGEKSSRAISFVGNEKPAGGIARDKDNEAARPLKTLPAWPMSVTYYDLDEKSEEPEYQVSFNMYENGVTTGLVLDYGDFALAGTLSELKMLDKPKCP